MSTKRPIYYLFSKLLLAIIVFSLLLLPIANLGWAPPILLMDNAQRADFSSPQSIPTPFFNISLLSPNNIAERNTWVEWIAEELPKFGIGITINDNTEWASIQPRVWAFREAAAPPTYDDGGYDVFISGWFVTGLEWGNTAFDDLHRYTTNPTYKIGAAGQNGYQNATLVLLFDNYRSEIDQDNRVSILKQIQAILHEDLPTIVYERRQWMLAPAYFIANENLTLSRNELVAFHFRAMADSYANFGFNNVSPIVIAGTYSADWEFPPYVAHREDAHEPNVDMVWQSLYERDPTDDFKWKPLLASGMPTWSNGNRTATIALRDDVTFADGKNLTAHDVVETFRIMMTPVWESWMYNRLCDWTLVAPNGSVVERAPQFASNDSIRALDNYTVEFTLTDPWAFALDLISQPIMPIHVFGNHTHPAVEILGNASLEEAYFEAVRLAPKTFGFGTGPYRYKEIHAESHSIRYNLTLEAVDTYWKGDVTTDEIILKEILDEAQILEAVRNGSVHLSTPCFRLSEDELQDTEGITLYDWFLGAAETLVFNMNHSILGTGVDTPLGKTNPSRAAEAARYVRHAIKHVIMSVGGWVGKQGFPNGTAVGGLEIAPFQRGFDHSLEPHASNLTKAIELLAKAGYTTDNGTTTTDSATSSETLTITTTSEDAAFSVTGFLSGLLVLATVAIMVNSRRKTD